MPNLLTVTNATTGMSGFANELDTGGAVTNKGGIDHADRQRDPGRVGSGGVHDPAADAVQAHGLRDRRQRRLAALRLGAERPRRRRGHDAAQQHEDERPAVRDVPEVGSDQPRRRAAVQLAGAEPPDGRSEPDVPGPPADPRQQHERRHRLVPDEVPTPPIAPPVPQAITECFSEFLPTSDYVGFAGTNASPPRLDFRFTARDNKGGDERREPGHDADARGRDRPVPRHVGPGFVGGRLDADGHLERRRHERGADQHGEREDLAVARRRAHVPVRAGGEHAERRLARTSSSRTRRRRTPASRSRRSGTSTSTSRTPTSRSRSRASSGSTRSGSAART